MKQYIKYLSKLCGIKFVFFMLVCPLFISADMPLDSNRIKKNLPIIKPEYNWELLRNQVSPELTKRLEDHLTQNKDWEKLIKKRKFAVGIVDISDIYNPEAAWINGNLMMYAASLPKIAVLLAAMYAFEEGQLEETPEIIQDMNDMIRKSDNKATSRVIDKVGLEKIEKVVTSTEFRLFDENKGGGLWVGKFYARRGKRNPDPLKGLSHAATVSQVCRFYYLLATGRMINPKRSQQMLDILSRPHLHHKFVSFLGKKYSLERIFRKSGTWKTWHSDSALVWSRDGKSRYIMAALVEHPKGEQIIRELASVVERVLEIKKVTKKK